MRALLSLLLLLPLTAQAELGFITLKHRNAESLIPLLQPVLNEGVRISGTGATLIVNCQPGQLKEIHKLLEQLDTPLQPLKISVVQSADATRSALHSDVSGTLQQPRVHVYATNKRTKEAMSQQLRVIEGQWAFISAGKSLPVTGQTTIHSHHGTSMQQSIEYQEVQSGFEVSPTLRGDSVTLQVRPFRARHSPRGGGIIEQQEIITTVSGRLGEWITIGGMDEERQHAGMGTVHTTGNKRSARHDVKLKVERLRN